MDYRRPRTPIESRNQGADLSVGFSGYFRFSGLANRPVAATHLAMMSFNQPAFVDEKSKPYGG